MIYGVGIDFGTGTSALAIVREANGSPRFIKPYPNRDGLLYVESAVAYDDNIGHIVTGKRAQKLSILRLAEKERVCFPIKPYLGKSDRFNLDKEVYSPQELAAYVIARLVRRAMSQEVLPLETLLSAPTVVSYPADADESQRQATLDAARLVGFTNVFGMAEPHAAAYTYVMHNRQYIVEKHQKLTEDHEKRRAEIEMDARAKPSDKAVLTRKVEESKREFQAALDQFYHRLEGRPFLVYDFGAGTFDAVVGEIRKDESGTLAFNILGRDGRKRVGGHYLSEDFGAAIIRRLKEETSEVPPLDASTRYQVFEYADEKKIQLSDEAAVDVFTKITLPDRFITIDQKWDRVRFKSEVLDKTLDQTIEVCQRAIQEAVEKSGRISGSDDIKHIFLVGGSSRIPFVKLRLQETFRKSVITDLRNLTWDATPGTSTADIGPTARISEELGDPITAVVGGAAIAAARYHEAERSGNAEGRTFLEALGVTSRSNFSVWWNTGGDLSPRFELICDRGEQLPYVYREGDIWPQDPRAKVVAWSIWESSLPSKELTARGFDRSLMTQIGRIQLRQELSDRAKQIQLTIHVNDDGEVTVEAIQDRGDQFKEKVKLPSVFSPTGGLSRDEFEVARKRVEAYLNAEDVW